MTVIRNFVNARPVAQDLLPVDTARSFANILDRVVVDPERQRWIAVIEQLLAHLADTDDPHHDTTIVSPSLSDLAQLVHPLYAAGCQQTPLGRNAFVTRAVADPVGFWEILRRLANNQLGVTDGLTGQHRPYATDWPSLAVEAMPSWAVSAEDPGPLRSPGTDGAYYQTLSLPDGLPHPYGTLLLSGELGPDDASDHPLLRLSNAGADWLSVTQMANTPRGLAVDWWDADGAAVGIDADAVVHARLVRYLTTARGYRAADQAPLSVVLTDYWGVNETPPTLAPPSARFRVAISYSPERLWLAYAHGPLVRCAGYSSGGFTDAFTHVTVHWPLRRRGAWRLQQLSCLPAALTPEALPDALLQLP